MTISGLWRHQEITISDKKWSRHGVSGVDEGASGEVREKEEWGSNKWSKKGFNKAQNSPYLIIWRLFCFGCP